MTEAELQAIKGRLAAASPGPWCVQVFDTIGQAMDYGFEWAEYEWDDKRCRGKPAMVWEGESLASSTGLPGSIEVGEHNADLIASAPTDLAALVAALEDARRRLAEAEAVLSDCAQDGLLAVRAAGRRAGMEEAEAICREQAAALHKGTGVDIAAGVELEYAAQAIRAAIR